MSNWYHLQIWRGDPSEDGAELLTEFELEGETVNPIDYVDGGADPLAPGLCYCRARTYDPIESEYGEEWVPLKPFYVRYEKAQRAIITSITQTGLKAITLQYLAPNTSKSIIYLQGPMGYQDDQVYFNLPDGSNDSRDLSVSIDYSLPQYGNYTFSIKTQNPLDLELGTYETQRGSFYLASP